MWLLFFTPYDYLPPNCMPVVVTVVMVVFFIIVIVFHDAAN